MLPPAISNNSQHESSLPRLLARALVLVALGIVLLTLPTVGCTSTTASSDGHARPPEKEIKTVKVTTQREGNLTHFFVENMEYCEVTMTFEMSLKNLKGESDFPHTATFPARTITPAFTLSPIDPDGEWDFSYTNHFKLGSNEARHDDSVVYLLPYSPGAKYIVTQAYNGSYSHKGSNKYAIDWKMPEGSPVHAARGGLVVRTKDDSDTGGASMKFDRHNNYVLIRHEDGTLGHYCHLEQGGCRVKPGQRVEAGQLIAHSGNTGFSSGPHLHFCVFKTKNGRERESLPVRFRTASDNAVTLIEDRRYTAAPVQHAASAKSESAIAAQGAVLQ